MSAAVAFERGLAAEKRGDFAAAEEAYQKSAAVFQKSDRVHARLFIASLKAGDKTVAREEFNFLRGREIDSGLAREINGLLRPRD
jgi:Flp pilus assembly protein TadD